MNNKKGKKLNKSICIQLIIKFLKPLRKKKLTIVTNNAYYIFLKLPIT